MQKPLMMGAVAYAPKVVTIWDGFKAYFNDRGLPFDFVLYSNYERQVEAQFSGEIDIAWNSPLAWIRAQRIAAARGVHVEAIAMRDTDRDLASVLVVNANAPITTLPDLRGRRIGFGAIDSPQASLIPRGVLRDAGLLAGRDYTALRFDVLAGKHGDHIGGEHDAAEALIRGDADAAWMIDSNYSAFTREGLLPAGATRILATTPPYDHCNFTTSPQCSAAQAAQFKNLLLSMSWRDPAVRPLLDLEGLKVWKDGRVSGYQLLERAVDDEKFYSASGDILERDYQY